jgi:GT2 family glycosyltransferase
MKPGSAKNSNITTRPRLIRRVRYRLSLLISSLYQIYKLILMRFLKKSMPHPYIRGRKKDFYEPLAIAPASLEATIESALNNRGSAKQLYQIDIISFSIIDWEFRFQRPQQIMSQFADRGHRVFYISTSRFIYSNSRKSIEVKKIRENIYEVSLNVETMPNIYGEIIGGENRKSILSSLEELRRMFRINEAVSFVMISSWASVALEARDRFGWPVIYDCMDEWENFPNIKPALLEMERSLVKRSDLVVVTAQKLYDKWEKSAKNLLLARNGTDFDFYQRYLKPNRLLADCKRPIVGYYGAIADWFDTELMTYIAEQRQEYTFVLIGGVFDVDVSRLEALPNVKLLGQQPYETMPQYLYDFDLCIIPFKINQVTESTDPVKLYEYLSGGKPVVTVAMSEILPYGEYIYIANDREDFVKKLDLAVSEKDHEKAEVRKRFAGLNTWADRYDRIRSRIDKIYPRASIIVVTYNNLGYTRLCLESVMRNTEYPNYEIVVVDNSSTDGTPEYLKALAEKYQNISLVLNTTNNGFARANNQGIEQSDGEYLVLLNNDTIVPPGWLSRLLHHLRNPEVGLVGPVTNQVGNEAKVEVDYRTWREMEEFAWDHTWNNDLYIADIHMLAMFCVAMRRETFKEVGCLDEQFGIGMFEDDDYSLRMREKGYRVICANDVFVHHFGQASFGKLIKTGAYNKIFEENRAKYEAKWNTRWIPHVHGALKVEKHYVATKGTKDSKDYVPFCG